MVQYQTLDVIHYATPRFPPL